MSVAGEGVHRHHNPDHDDEDERQENEARCQSPPFGIEPTRVFNTSVDDDEDEEPCEIELPTTNGYMTASAFQERGLHQNPQYQAPRPLTPTPTTAMMRDPPPAIPSTVPYHTDRPPATSPLSQESSSQLPRTQQAIESEVVTAFAYHPALD